tara:strand:+ start:158 stop:1165 length:1008 start_codon:yes stop_codon:yes gene_type:complete
MSINPREIPTGAVRYNTDSNKMEVYIGSAWMEVAVTESAPLGGRMLVQQGGISPYNKIDYLNISTKGNGVDFGDTTKNYYECAAVGNKTRGVFAGGTYGSDDNVMEFVTIATTGNAADFGDMAQSNNPGGGGGDQTRGILTGGASPASNMISFFNITSLGDATDFGVDQPFSGAYAGALSSPTRTLMFGGRSSPYTAHNSIWFVTTQTTGIVNDFGDYTNQQHSGAGVLNAAGASSSTRGIIAGGFNNTNPAGQNTNQMEFVTIATTGNSTDFGDLTQGTQMSKGASNCVRGMFAHGGTRVDELNIASLGNATIFGDLNFSTSSGMSLSNAHGGL